MRSSLILLTAIASSALHPLLATGQTWIQQGADIDGDTIHGLCGYSVSMPDAYTVGIGSYDDQSPNVTGKVRVFTWTGSAWVQKGADVHGQAIADGTGRSVSMPDANTVGMGAPSFADPAAPGEVRIHAWDGTAWVQKGAAIQGEAAGDRSGAEVSMPDANTVAIGAALNNNANGDDAGHVRIYSWDGSAWVQKGADIDGEGFDDSFGHSVSMPDANTVAIGAPWNDGNGTTAGHVRIYSWDGSAWVQKGMDINGEAALAYCGYAVSMPDASTVAVASPWHDGNGFQIGHVRIFSWNGNAWVQKGGNIDGEADDDRSGSSLSMPDANTVGVGSLWNDGSASDAGHVRIHSWDGSTWVQVGTDIDGEAADDNSAVAVSMPDAHTIAIGAPLNDGYAPYAGHVRIYGDGTVTVQENDRDHSAVVYPNPFQDQVTIELGAFRSSVQVIVRNVLGQEVIRETHTSIDRSVLRIPGPPGIYALELRASDGRIAVVNVVKE